MRKVKLFKEIGRNKLLENSGIDIIQSANLISIDIQPEYEDGIYFDLHDYVEFLNTNYHKLNSLTFLYNGADTLGMISEYDYINWLMELGLDNDIINDAKFYDKGYAYFRYCMDEGIDDDEIVDLVRYMLQNNVNDSRDIDNDMWADFMNKYNHTYTEIRDLLEVADDCINIPDLMDYLNNYSGKIVICGGGVNECLKEVEIALMALDKNYNILTKFTY